MGPGSCGELGESVVQPAVEGCVTDHESAINRNMVVITAQARLSRRKCVTTSRVQVC
ncbi:hypothetical protein DPMN_008712 [Dreissena polymorpha]|uniref:Uncharacterized protein n=1 Tax=Dreissena polymorpha TaxID=45954 RepID=A0A9D4MZA9_DREPO|nr:hypothetical protein DPMN_008712 [Dreissena polymorpha]